MRRAWTVDVAADAGGNPVAVFQARAGGSDTDHRFFYGRWDGAQWQVNQMGYAGSYLYAAENDYTGLVSIDPNDPNTVYLSSEVHPATKAQLIGADGLRHYELFKGKTTDNGVTWNWTPITFNSTMHNIRPLVPKWDGTNKAVLWLRGDYTTYTNYDTDAVALINPELPDPQLAVAIDFGATGQTVQPGFQPFTRDANPAGTDTKRVVQFAVRRDRRPGHGHPGRRRRSICRSRQRRRRTDRRHRRRFRLSRRRPDALLRQSGLRATTSSCSTRTTATSTN